MTKDGDKCENFHKKLDNQNPTITLFKSEDYYKFIGYINKFFDSLKKNK